jgi:hypothetical protein
VIHAANPKKAGDPVGEMSIFSRQGAGSAGVRPEGFAEPCARRDRQVLPASRRRKE